MTETKQMDEFERLLNESFTKKFNVADVVEGRVVKREKDYFLVDIGAKVEAILPDREVTNSTDKKVEDLLQVGDIKDFYILKEADIDHDEIYVSLKKVSYAQAWQTLQAAKANNDSILATVVALVKGGVIVEVAELRGFIPASQLRTGTPFDGLIGKEIEVKILEADAKKNKLIFSQRQVLAEQRDQVVDNVLANLELNQVVQGETVRITDFGAFVDINGVDGLLPISEISWQRIKHPSDVLTLGDTIEVRILKIDMAMKRISLSLKRMGENPWEEIENKFEEGQVIKGTINKLTSFGAFINIFPGVEALLPVAEMKEANANPFELYNVGDEIEVLIKKFTPQEHRIALSVKDINETEAK